MCVFFFGGGGLKKDKGILTWSRIFPAFTPEAHISNLERKSHYRPTYRFFFRDFPQHLGARFCRARITLTLFFYIFSLPNHCLSVIVPFDIRHRLKN
jgi:hypothetical protein